jgi:hypothetical protein
MQPPTASLVLSAGNSNLCVDVEKVDKALYILYNMEIERSTLTMITYHAFSSMRADGSGVLGLRTMVDHAGSMCGHEGFHRVFHQVHQLINLQLEAFPHPFLTRLSPLVKTSWRNPAGYSMTSMRTNVFRPLASPATIRRPVMTVGKRLSDFIVPAATPEKYELAPIHGTTEQERPLLDPQLWKRFDELDQGNKVCLEYVWIGGTGKGPDVLVDEGRHHAPSNADADTAHIAAALLPLQALIFAQRPGLSIYMLLVALSLLLLLLLLPSAVGCFPSRVISKVPTSPSELPNWNYDGSSTGQVTQ